MDVESKSTPAQQTQSNEGTLSGTLARAGEGLLLARARKKLRKDQSRKPPERVSAGWHTHQTRGRGGAEFDTRGAALRSVRIFH